MKKVFISCLLIAFAGLCSAANSNWIRPVGSGPGNWNDASNWDVLPNLLTAYTYTTPVVDLSEIWVTDSQTYGERLYHGIYSSALAESPVIRIKSGGSLTYGTNAANDDHVFIGYTYVGKMIIEAGGTLAPRAKVYCGHVGGSNGTLDVAGTLDLTALTHGMLVLAGTDTATGVCNVLDGGVVKLWTFLDTYRGIDQPIRPGGLLNIEGTGKVVRAGNELSEAQAFLARESDHVAGNGVLGNVVASYDADLNETTITALPAPPLSPALSIIETASSTKVYESGQTTDTFTLALTTEPQYPVAVMLSELEYPNQILVAPTTISFNSTNFNVPQLITVSAIDDPDIETFHHNAMIGFTLTSSDTDYNGLTVDDFSVTIVDDESDPSYPIYSGIYPHLAVTNGGSECGIGAVVDWAENLWYVTYSPHKPTGSDDGLYQLSSALEAVKRPESVGGTPANRMIHTETNQLAIGSYIIESDGTVHTIPLSTMPGRMTGSPRHLTDPANMIYFVTMEEGLYEVNMNTYGVTELHKDGNVGGTSLVPGYHAKGAYTGQGRLVITNNGNSGGDGVLAEWDGTGDPGDPSSWTTVDGNKYTDVTGPGGIYGNESSNDPLWAIGWDARSVLLNVCDNGGTWKRYRMPKASYTQDADQGWFTEWPRIRPVFDKYLMTMHGMIWDFPGTFTHGSTAGIRPIASHLKMIVDFEEWGDELVLACNDASLLDSSIIGRSQSNLRFTTLADLDDLGGDICSGGPWVNDYVAAGQYSEPYLFAGFEKRVISFSHNSASPVIFTIEVDINGDENWTVYDTLTVSASGFEAYTVPSNAMGEWVRFKADANVTTTVYLNYSNEKQKLLPQMMDSIPEASDNARCSVGLIRPDSGNELILSFSVDVIDSDGSISYTGYYEVDGDMNFTELNGSSIDTWFRSTYPTTKDFDQDDASVKFDYDGITYRIPKNEDPFYSSSTAAGWPRGERHIVTEREMMNIHGTFYEVPHWRSGGKVKIRPICTHNRRIFDYCSWRGMLVLSGNFTGIAEDDHYLPSDDGLVGLWFGNVDDLYKMGVPRGQSGPWKDTAVSANVASDPYLMYGYEKKIVELSHDAPGAVTFTVEVDIAGTKTFSQYGTFVVQPGQTYVHEFPLGYNAHWVRVKADTACTATAWFIYNPLSDGTAGLDDLSSLAQRWLDTNCGYCSGADLTFDGLINMDDMAAMGMQWLK